CRGLPSLRASPRQALCAADAREEWWQSVLRNSVLHGTRRGEAACFRPGGDGLALGSVAHSSETLFRRRCRTYYPEIEAAARNNAGSFEALGLPGEQRENILPQSGLRRIRGVGRGRTLGCRLRRARLQLGRRLHISS